MKKNRILAVALSAGLVLAGSLTPALAAEQPAETAQEAENNETGFSSEAAAEKAAKEAMKKDGVNNAFNIRKDNNGKYFYELKIESKEEETPAEDNKTPEEGEKETPKEEEEELPENNDNGYKSEEAAQKAGEKDLKDKKLEESYQVEVRKEASLNKDNDKEARYFYRFVLKEEDKKPEDKKPEDKKPEDKKPEDKKPEVKPTPEYTPAKPEDKTPAR